jgi:ketose-bisphosphate aldolase
MVNMKAMLKAAQRGRYAVGAFNILDYASMKAVIRAAEDVQSPVIVQTSTKTVEFWGAETMISWYRQLAEKSPVPVAIHLDHCKDPKLIEVCINAGWTSVMIDTSSKPFEENLRLSKIVVDMARTSDVSVEAELGEIGGVEDDITVAGESAHLADPEKAVRFCAALELDCFAPAIGTAHGIYKGDPKIAFDRLKTIAANTGVPIALHGGTGLSDDVFRKCISLGAAKVNISTQIKYAFINAFVNYHQSHAADYNPLKILDAQARQITLETTANIMLFGGAGKA